MDLSKLPKLSGDVAQAKTEAPPQSAPQSPPLQPAAPPAPPDVIPYAGSAPSVGADVWFSLIVGLLLLYMGRNFAAFALARLQGHAYHTGWTLNGAEVPYFQLAGHVAETDAGMFLFGLVLLLDAALRVVSLRRGAGRTLLLLAAALTLLTTLFNAVVCAQLMTENTLPLLSGLAVAFGGWIFFDQLRALKQPRRPVY